MADAEGTRYCIYCGRVARRCRCGEPGSDFVRFAARSPEFRRFHARYREAGYTRGVPPQVKRHERTRLRGNAARFYADLVERYGERCLNCGGQNGLVIDHVVPIARGGKSEPANLQLLCAVCNRLKGKLVIDCRDAAYLGDG